MAVRFLNGASLRNRARALEAPDTGPFFFGDITLAKTNSGVLRTFGDSLTEGSAATSAANRFTNIIAAGTSLSLTNWGRATTQIDDLSSGGNGIWAVNLASQGFLADGNFAANDTHTCMIGYNDVRQIGPNVNFQRQFQKEMNGLIGWLAIPNSQKRRLLASSALNTAQWTFAGGTWTPFTGWGGNFGAFTSANNATATLNASLTGDVVQIWWGATFNAGTDAAPPGVIVTIDGKDYGPFSCRSPFFNSGVWQVFGARISGLTNTAHTIAFKASTSGGANIVAGGVACYNSQAGDGCNVYMADIPYMWMAQPAANIAAGTVTTPDGYSAQSGYTLASQWATGHAGVAYRDQVFRDYNQIIYDECRAAVRSGLKVANVMTNAVYDPQGMTNRVEPQQSHPQDGGHAAIAQQFIEEIQRPFFLVPY